MKKVNSRLVFLSILTCNFLATGAEGKKASPREPNDKYAYELALDLKSIQAIDDAKDSARLTQNSPTFKEAWGEEKPRRRQSICISQDKFIDLTLADSDLYDSDDDNKKRERDIIACINRIRIDTAEYTGTPHADTIRPASESIDEPDEK